MKIKKCRVFRGVKDGVRDFLKSNRMASSFINVLCRFCSRWPELYFYLRRLEYRIYFEAPAPLRAMGSFAYNEPSLYLHNESFECKLRRALDKFLPLEQKLDCRKLKRLRADIVDCFFRYHAMPDEYFVLGFEQLSPEKRATFLTDIYKDSYIDYASFWNELQNKYAYYEAMQAFFKRKAVHVRQEQDKAAFLSLAAESSRLFAKPLCGAYGLDARLLNIEDAIHAEKVFDELLSVKGEGWIVEECIIQTSDMAAWNPDSVNTVRIPSFLVDNEIHVVAPFFRTGRKGYVIDNAGGGGIFACVDPSSGVITTDGVDEMCRYYAQHPESGLTYKGTQLPAWQELLSVAEAAHRAMPNHRYLAFDFAHTRDGWVLVEGNWGQFVSQYNDRIGLKKMFEYYMKHSC